MPRRKLSDTPMMRRVRRHAAGRRHRSRAAALLLASMLPLLTSCASTPPGYPPSPKPGCARLGSLELLKREMRNGALSIEFDMLGGGLSCACAEAPLCPPRLTCAALALAPRPGTGLAEQPLLPWGRGLWLLQDPNAAAHRQRHAAGDDRSLPGSPLCGNNTARARAAGRVCACVRVCVLGGGNVHGLRDVHAESRAADPGTRQTPRRRGSTRATTKATSTCA